MARRARSTTAAFVDLLRELDRERKVTKARVVEICGRMSESTWKRLKRKLRQQKCPLTWHPREKYFTVPIGWTLGPARLDPRFRDRLAVLRANAAALGSPFIDRLAPVFDMLDAQLASVDPEARAKLPPRRPQPRSDKQFFARLNQVEAAVRDKRMISFVYEGGSTPDRRRTIAPYALYDHLGRFYVWGPETTLGTPKFFALDLIDKLKILEEFQPNPALSIEDRLRHSFGIFVGQGPPQRIVVEFSGKAAPYVRARRWPAENEPLREERRADGTLRLTFEVNDPREVAAWVLSFGGDARIVEPASVAELVRRHAFAIGERHDWAERVPVDENFLQLDWSEET